MGVEPIFDARNWGAVPFHFWSVVFFVFGCMVGSFLNVVIHRLPLDQSVISPPSHCPHCRYSIPWYLNIPLVTWVVLRGRCRNCGAPISLRYFLVELLTGAMFLMSWLGFGRQSAAVAIVICVVLSGLIAATFIDLEHYIIPDEITIGGMAAGVVCSLLVPALHGEQTLLRGMAQSFIGMAVGGGVIYLILRLGKMLFGRQRVSLPEETKIVFGETCVHLPDRDIPYEELFYRRSDVIVLQARTVELPDRCYRDVVVRLSPEKLMIGDDVMDPEQVPHLEAVSSEITLPREAMGFGDVKFMAAIGAFLGWKAVLFSLVVSSFLGAVIGSTMILLRKRERASQIPYGPYIAAAAVIWIFAGPRTLQWYDRLMASLVQQ
ncbi:MAG TPA: prepilin peptidase [Verrucomicrobia bacterium]|nr:prepilin peptidase [Verrucomicrobiota bacterium]HOB33279.1 prepilin peptidase [Verrucomicrobiota bacterium]HOP97166.1 prepilin peptidase [Verrucomicrobiota bacterium]HPU55718.1 prepilin peptidase [Verrucomicrobiota bacterium]